MPLLPFPLFLHSSFAVYDADSYAPCRYHLLPRVVPPPVLLPNGSVTSSPLPGTAARWRLPAASSGLDRHAQMVHRVNTMYQTYMLYYFLQVREKEGAGVTEFGQRAGRRGRGDGGWTAGNSVSPALAFSLLQLLPELLNPSFEKTASPRSRICRASFCSCSSCTSSTQSASSRDCRLFQVGNCG